ncbi:CBS domain-containing protein [Pandoraea cepalis]|uniref:CBS domain-containing protein n=1 Tax=Pandoraea cepalis TaxID=2508294 RepID=UPI0034645699
MTNAKRNVGDVMLKSPITVEPGQPIAHARQLMLMHSFSFPPVRLNNFWHLISELGLARYLYVAVNEKGGTPGKVDRRRCRSGDGVEGSPPGSAHSPSARKMRSATAQNGIEVSKDQHLR